MSIDALANLGEFIGSIGVLVNRFLASTAIRHPVLSRHDVAQTPAGLAGDGSK